MPDYTYSHPGNRSGPFSFPFQQPSIVLSFNYESLVTCVKCIQICKSNHLMPTGIRSSLVSLFNNLALYYNL